MLREISKIYIFFHFLGNVSPAVGILCYKCNSVTLEDCAMILSETVLPYEPCPGDSQCVMSIVDSITYRGCSSDTPTVGANYMKSCSKNLCNKGVYPPGRLKCYHCTGSNCVDAPVGKANPCRNHLEEDECYTQVIGMNAVNRGCRSDSNRTNTDVQMVYCNYNGCNNRPALGKLVCAQCDSINQRGCKMNLPTVPNCNITQYEQCEVDILITGNEACFLYHNRDRVVRGCTRYIPEDIALDVDHRHECNSTDFCNLACLKQQNCIVCDSSKYEACRNDASTIPQSVCASAEISSCFTCEHNNWTVERGCGSPTRESESIQRCYECDLNAGCNENSLIRCYKCSTAIAGANCASWERPGYNIGIEECEFPHASCITATLANGTIERGCRSSHLSCNETLLGCVECSGSFCNHRRYPADRLRCYQCVGDKDCAMIDVDPFPCTAIAVEPFDACFEFSDNNMGGTVRGCRSNALLYYRCILHDAGIGCRVCHKDGCNNTPSKGVYYWIEKTNNMDLTDF